MMLDTLSTPWKKYVSDRVYISLELELISSIVPGQSYSLPIEAVTQNRVRIQPDRAQPILPYTHGSKAYFELQRALAISGVQPSVSRI